MVFDIFEIETNKVLVIGDTKKLRVKVRVMDFARVGEDISGLDTSCSI